MCNLSTDRQTDTEAHTCRHLSRGVKLSMLKDGEIGYAAIRTTHTTLTTLTSYSEGLRGGRAHHNINRMWCVCLCVHVCMYVCVRVRGHVLVGRGHEHSVNNHYRT